MTDAQHASVEVRNRQRRDQRRIQRATDPAFRAAEAEWARAYRARKAGQGLWEVLPCSCCRRQWARIPHSGPKPKTCPPCRDRTNEARRRLRQERKQAGVCVRCASPIGRAHTLCDGCADDAATKARAKRKRRHRLTCEECGEEWLRPAKGGFRPRRCPSCR